MKLLYSILFFAMTSVAATAQPLATTFEKAESLGISVKELDNTYPSAAHSQPAKGVFKERQDEFLTHYRDLHIALSKYLSENGFDWPETTRLFTRVYFNSSGAIDYFLINPNEVDLTEKQVENYFKLLNEFIKDYKLPIFAETGFAQCSPVTYIAKKKDI
ncbi:MAG: hypothetical protein WC967_07525 [Balneolaceae bacterium]